MLIANMHPPLPAELFNNEQMEQYGSVLAQSHRLTQNRTVGILLNRLEQSEAILIKSYQILSKTSTSTNHITPAGEWLLDNFYLIEEQISIIKKHLSKGYEKSLPQLAGGALQNYPRIYDIAQQMIQHSDGRWDLKTLCDYLHSYQNVTPLTLAELWAVPTLLRLAVVENLSRVSVQVVSNMKGHHLADSWADKMEEVAVSDPEKLVLVIADMVRSEPPMMNAFVAELARRLQSAALALPLTWMEQKLEEEGLTIQQLVQAENTQQAADQVTVSHCIASLRRLSGVVWRDFVEKMSVVEHITRRSS